MAVLSRVCCIVVGRRSMCTTTVPALLDFLVDFNGFQQLAQLTTFSVQSGWWHGHKGVLAAAFARRRDHMSQMTRMLEWICCSFALQGLAGKEPWRLWTTCLSGSFLFAFARVASNSRVELVPIWPDMVYKSPRCAMASCPTSGPTALQWTQSPWGLRNPRHYAILRAQRLSVVLEGNGKGQQGTEWCETSCR